MSEPCLQTTRCTQSTADLENEMDAINSSTYQRMRQTGLFDIATDGALRIESIEPTPKAVLKQGTDQAKGVL